MPESRPVRRERSLPPRPERSAPARRDRTLALPWARSGRLVPRVVVQPAQRFLATESASGIVLVAAAVVALVWANSGWSASYERLWSTSVDLSVGSVGLHEDLRHWVNDLAMALFFFVVGLEIKREIVFGDLRRVRSAMLPVACAIGGMVVPALVYSAVNAGGPAARGWGIPMATDIAFAVGVLALVGRRVPASLKIFLLTLAIVDDIGAIVVIAVVYSSGVHLVWLGGAALGIAAIVALRALGVRSLVPYAVVAAAIWLCTFESGVHATLAGVVLGLLTPARPFHRARDVQAVVAERLTDPVLSDAATDEDDETTFTEISRLTREGVSPLNRLETVLHPWSAFVVLPLFALANAGVVLPDNLADRFGAPVTLGVILGLVVGKPIGILLAALVTTKVAGAHLPRHCGWVELIGVSMLGGIGFTVSLFIAGLAFTGELADGAKIGILAASVIASALGAALLLARGTPDPLVPPSPG